MKNFNFPKTRQFSACAALTASLSFAPGCLLPTASTIGNNSTASTTTTTPSALTVITGTPRAAKIIFKQAYPGGSFDAPPTAGTPATPGSGLAATRVFNADGSLLSNDPSATSSTWPKWLKRFEIGISGPSNLSATNSSCAKFADATESSATNCNFGGGAIGCGASSGLFRVSEYDCLQNPPTNGTGGANDGIYLRASLDRTQLGTGENIMAVIEYIASSFSPAPASPTTCFLNGAVSAEGCSNVTWKIFTKHNINEVVQPFLMLVPPNQNFVNTGLSTSGVTPSTRQFYIPLSPDPALSVIQISRTGSNLTLATPNFQTTCDVAGAAATANSPLCAGIVIYSLTLYRM